jgi:molybdopterin-binding protein
VLASVITKPSQKLGLTEGKDAYAIVKSTDVMLATD